MRRIAVDRIVVAMMLASLVATAAAADADGLVVKAAKFPVAETVERLDKVLKGAGMTVFATIDHASAAEKSGLRMPPATLIVFGNPKGGTPMMLNAPTIAIDLPMKILVWEDSTGKSWVSYNSATYVAGRHKLRGMEKQMEGLDGALSKLTAGVVE
jgi:uncharacterized protein (DUF302 family)